MRVIARVVVGSHLYGTALPTSDTDLKEVFVPDAMDILLQRADKITRAENEKDDIERIPLHRYIELLLEGQTSAMDMLFAHEGMIRDTTEEWEYIKDAGRKWWISKNVTKMVGFCKGQAYMYCVKAERMYAAETVAKEFVKLSMKDKKAKLKDCFFDVHTVSGEHVDMKEIEHPDGRKEKYLYVCGKMIPMNDTVEHALKVVEDILSKYGKRVKKTKDMQYKDWKALMHAIRVAEEARELLSDGKITFPRPNANLLLQIKKGEIPFDVIDTMISTTINQIESLTKTTKLPDRGLESLAWKFVEDTYRKEINEQYEQKAEDKE